MKKENKDGICYRTRMPKMTLRDEWQIKLHIIANSDESNFSSHKEYVDYIEENTQRALVEQQNKLKALAKS